MPEPDFDPPATEEYHRLTRRAYPRARDFAILHYCATTREDPPLWRDCAPISVPVSLRWKIEHLRAGARLISERFERFQNPSWLAVLIGQQVGPARRDPLSDGDDRTGSTGSGPASGASSTQRRERCRRHRPSSATAGPLVRSQVVHEYIIVKSNSNLTYFEY